MTDRPWPAPAKLNLFLHITGRRADGYHTLQTVFQFLDAHDLLHVRVTADRALRLRGGPPGLVPEENLVLRAARLLQQESGTSLGAVLRLDKRLPVGGGLGGGSSDAATTLVALNRLWGLEWPPARLAALALRLGADVPVFVYGHAAWAEGVGEQLAPIELPTPWYVVLHPDCQISTAAVFAAPELTRDSPLTKISAFRLGDGRNDCEPVVRRRYPAVARALEVLSRWGQARLTGTGSCVFAPFPERESAQEVLARCREAGQQGFIARGLNRSPLRERLEAEAAVHQA